MGEYAKYCGKEIKIGTCESMYYLRFDQRRNVSKLDGNVDPNGPEALSIRFRFPFPDEDHIQPGGFDDYNRAIRIDGFPMPGEAKQHYSVQFSARNGYLVSLPCPESGDNSLGLTIHKNGYGGATKLSQQKLLADGRLVPVVECGGCGAAWRIEEPDEIIKLADCARAMADGKGPATEKFWGTIADRILAGAGIEVAKELAQ